MLGTSSPRQSSSLVRTQNTLCTQRDPVIPHSETDLLPNERALWNAAVSCKSCGGDKILNVIKFLGADIWLAMMEPSLNPCSLVIAPSVFMADTWLMAQLSVKYAPTCSKTTTLESHQIQVSTLSSLHPLSVARGCDQSPNKAASPHSEQLRGFVFMFLRAGAIKLVFTALGAAASWADHNAGPMVGSESDQTQTPLCLTAADQHVLPPSSAKHHPCYLLCWQWGPLASTPAQSDPICTLQPQPGLGQREEEDTDRGRLLLPWACGLQYPDNSDLAAGLMMTNNKLANNQPVLMYCTLRYRGSG